MVVNRLSRQRADDILLDFLRALIARAVQYRLQRLKVAPGGGLQRTANQGSLASPRLPRGVCLSKSIANLAEK